MKHDDVYVILVGDRIIATVRGKDAADRRAAKLAAIGLNVKVANLIVPNRIYA